MNRKNNRVSAKTPKELNMNSFYYKLFMFNSFGVIKIALLCFSIHV
jgi:hypothetical protein